MGSNYFCVNQFSTIEKIYNNTKPIKESGYGTTRDIRPLGSRSRKYERVIKISRNCYAMIDACHESYVNFGAQYTTSYHGRKVEDIAPILWRRDSQGNEFVRIRNGMGSHAHVARYSFLERAVPFPMRFTVGNGKQYVGCADYGLFYLPKGVTTPTKNKKLYLEFQRIERCGSWKLVSEEHTIPKIVVTLDKEAKKEIKPYADKFWDWWCCIAPMIDISWESNVVYRNQYAEYMKSMRLTEIHKIVDENLFVEVLKNDDHPLRMYMAHKFTQYSDINDKWRPCTDTKKLRAKFNNFVNRESNLITKTKEN